jgi:excisionase family DNA binding protein
MKAATVLLKHLIPALQAAQNELIELERNEKPSVEAANTRLRQEESHGPRDGASTSQIKLLSVPEAAAFLGLKVPTIYQLTCSRRIPFYKVGSRTMFKEQQLWDWLEGFSVAPIDGSHRSGKRRRTAST